MPSFLQLFTALCVTSSASAFTPSSTSSSSLLTLVHPPRLSAGPLSQPYKANRLSSPLKLSNFEDGENKYNNNNNSVDSVISCWNPNLRKTLAAISSLGVLETGYLTLDKLSYNSNAGDGLVGAFCTGDSTSPSCSDVLHGPYASLHLPGGLDIPLSALGMGAYSIVLILAILPLISGGNNINNNIEGEADAATSTTTTTVLDANNRIALLGTTTLMASFSAYLVSLIIGVLHASCAFCFASAGLSVSLAGLSWIGGMLPSVEDTANSNNNSNASLETIVELRKKGVTVGASSVGAATIIALGLFLSVDGNAMSSSSEFVNGGSSTLLAPASSSSSQQFQKNIPPPITTTSTPEALQLASDMKSLQSRMFGAFWCSHCYDQKQALGFEAMQTLPYIECDREGYGNQRDLCKEKEVPGYPTWEIGGKLFPGERSVEELREIVDGVLKEKGGNNY